MSIHINGFRFSPNLPITQVGYVLDSVRDAIVERREVEFAKHVAAIAARRLDWLTIHPTSISEGRIGSSKLAPYQHACKEVDEERQRDASGFATAIDFGCKIWLFPGVTGTIAILVPGQAWMQDILLASRHVEPLPFWDNTDRPENLTQEQWEERRRLWTRTLGKGLSPATNGLRRDLSPFAELMPMPSAEDVLANLPEFETRVLKAARSKVTVDLMAGRNLEAFIEASAALERGEMQGPLAQASAIFRDLLLMEPSADDLTSTSAQRFGSHMGIKHP